MLVFSFFHHCIACDCRIHEHFILIVFGFFLSKSYILLLTGSCLGIYFLFFLFLFFFYHPIIILLPFPLFFFLLLKIFWWIKPSYSLFCFIILIHKGINFSKLRIIIWFGCTHLFCINYFNLMTIFLFVLHYCFHIN